MKRAVRDSTYDAAAALLASAVGGDIRSIRSTASRLKRLARRLERFNFHLVVQPLAELLTRPENHSATARFEVLIHLAALACRGERAPTRQQLREWLNVVVLQDPVTELEGPVEDVFVSNVVTWFGNVRLFEGRWQGNSDYVQTCIEGLLRIGDRPWAAETLGPVMAMLRISEAVAQRAQVVRYTLKASEPRRPVTINVSTLSQSASRVSFVRDELDAIGVVSADLDPFVFQAQHAELLADESLGHTALERRPILRFEGRTIIVLPNAIGAAIRRFVIERAAAAGELRPFQSACHQTQYREVFLSGRAGWEIEYRDALKHDPDNDLREFVGTFDNGGYVHLVFVPDDFEEIARKGLLSVHSLKGLIERRVRERASSLASKTDYRRGLTVLVHGGIGRDFTGEFGKFPDNWHYLGLSVPDFMLLGNESEFTAMRAWKLLQQESDLGKRGVLLPNLRGFLNLVAFGYYNGFELVPINMNLRPIYLHNDFIAPLRHRILVALDQHGTVTPDGQSWIPVQRETTGGFFGGMQNRPVFVVPPHMIEEEFMACVETAASPWWIRCNEFPKTKWHRSIVVKMLETVVGWLVRVASLLEKRLAALPSAPMSYRFRFPDLESLTQSAVPAAEMSSAPVIALEDGQAVIDCGPGYLRSFLRADNSGDRMLIEALVRASHAFCGIPAPADSAMVEFVQTVASSNDARFFQMTPGHTPQDAIYDTTALSEPRFLLPEDLAWSRLDLVRRAGYKSAPGPIPTHQAAAVLGEAVDVVWERVRSRLVSLSRESVIERSLLNFVAVQKDRRDWLRSAAAQLALHDSEEVLAAANRRDVQRDVASLACRVIAEMALCTSPYRGGQVCTGTDLDFLIAEVATLLECAAQRDAAHYGLVAHPPIMYANGSFGFDPSTGETIGPLREEYGKRLFREAAIDHGDGLASSDEDEMADGDFEAAFIAEFGLSMEQYAEFVLRVTENAVERRAAHLRFPRSEAVRWLREIGVPKPDRVFEAFALAPRARWDEKNPRNAEKKDWYPWRYSRRLSILRRPLVQLSTEADPEVLVLPSLLAGTLDYLSSAASGRLPGDLFDSPEMISCIGRAADRIGHDFNRRVAERLDGLRWKTQQELSLTQLGGKAELGDIDVLTWRTVSGLVYAIECKSLRFDRTFGEIGERLSEYGVGTVGGRRTELQKHLDRVAYLKCNRERLSKFTDIPIEQLQLRSGLVTEKLVAMQFSGPAQDVLDLVTDFDLLNEAFGKS